MIAGNLSKPKAAKPPTRMNFYLIRSARLFSMSISLVDICSGIVVIAAYNCGPGYCIDGIYVVPVCEPLRCGLSLLAVKIGAIEHGTVSSFGWKWPKAPTASFKESHCPGQV